MDFELIILSIFLGITGIAMGSIGINCYNKHGSIGENFEKESNYRYLVFMLMGAIFATLYGIYAGVTHQTTANILAKYA